MKSEIENIELINKYLNGKLSENEVNDFNNRLESDAEFKTFFEEHIIFLEGLKRLQLIGEIKKGKHIYVRNKWLKYFGLGSIIFVLIVLTSIYIFKSFNNDLKEKLNFESELKQTYSVAHDSVVEIKGRKGTKIRFNSNDLETFSKDSLSIELLELTTKQDLLFTNAQTVSNKKWLVSGGAFKIDIKQGGKSIVLKAGKTIDVTFPKTSSEDNMELFYGERDGYDNMNWSLSDISLTEEKPFYVIYYNDTILIDDILTKRYGVDTYKDIIQIDSLGFLFLSDIKMKFPEIKDYKNQKDTLRILKRFVYTEQADVELDVSEGLIRTDSTTTVLIKREYFEQIRLWSQNINNFNIANESSAEAAANYINQFYQTVQLLKLGWINIDKFARDEEKVNVRFSFNIDTNSNEIYIIDKKNNTVLNVYNDNVDLPLDRSFYIIAIGIKGKDIYGFKKSVRFNKQGNLRVDYKRINKSQIKSILTLD